jgi:hypothetical protein
MAPSIMAIAMTACIMVTTGVVMMLVVMMLVVMTLVVSTAADMDGLTVVADTTRYGNSGIGGIYPDPSGACALFSSTGEF